MKTWEESESTSTMLFYTPMLSTEEEVNWSQLPEESSMLVNYSLNQDYKNQSFWPKLLAQQNVWEESIQYWIKEEESFKKKNN